MNERVEMPLLENTIKAVSHTSREKIVEKVGHSQVCLRISFRWKSILNAERDAEPRRRAAPRRRNSTDM